MNATLLPSGEMLSRGPSVVFSGAGIWNRTGTAGEGGFSRKWRNAMAASPMASAPATTHGSLPLF